MRWIQAVVETDQNLDYGSHIGLCMSDSCVDNDCVSMFPLGCCMDRDKSLQILSKTRSASQVVEPVRMQHFCSIPRTNPSPTCRFEAGIRPMPSVDFSY